jgi:dipeptidyl aminopeptidase/acylaminoacyl peptidase
LPLTGGEASKVTDLPLDVDNFRLSPQGDRLLFSMAVYRDCADLACKKRADEQAKVKASGKVYDKLFVRHWDTWADGRNNVLYSAPIDASGKVSANRSASAASSTAMCRPSRSAITTNITSARTARWPLGPHRRKTEAWSTNFDVYTVPVTGGEPKNLTADNKAGTPRPSIRRTARRWPYGHGQADLRGRPLPPGADRRRQRQEAHRG